MILLRKLRRDQDLTQRQLWLDSGVDPSQISKAERWGLVLNTRDSKKLANALGWTGDPAALFEEVENV